MDGREAEQAGTGGRENPVASGLLRRGRMGTAETVRFLRSMEDLTLPGDRNNARAALEVIAAANTAMFKRIRRELHMERAMRAIFGEDWARRWNEGLQQGLEQGRKEYEAILADRDRALADKERELEEMARQLRELKVQYGLA